MAFERTTYGRVNQHYNDDAPRTFNFSSATDAKAAIQAANIIADGGTNLTYQKVRQVNERFNELAVPMQDRYFGISASGESSILNIEQFTNNFFTNTGVGPGRITMGSLDGSQTMGMNWTIIPTMTEGGLPKAGNIRSLFAWHKWALGLAIGQDMFTEINYIPQNTVWLVNGIHFLGAIVIALRCST